MITHSPTPFMILLFGGTRAGLLRSAVITWINLCPVIMILLLRKRRPIFRFGIGDVPVLLYLYLITSPLGVVRVLTSRMDPQGTPRRSLGPGSVRIALGMIRLPVYLHSRAALVMT